VLGEIASLDPAAPPIQFQVNLPEQWNGRAVQYGGAGFNGKLVSGLEPLKDAPLDQAVPVARGFATWGTDSGHDETKLPEIQAFALNSEALENFAFASYKKVRDVAVEIVRVRYGSVPRHIYYYGSSEGGREGLNMAQRFPTDFDGIVSIAPVINWVGLHAAATRNEMALKAAGSLTSTTLKALRRGVLHACDAADGLIDGVISNYGDCAFDPTTLRCPDGADADNCLSEAQIDAVKTIHSLYTFSFALAHGIRSYPPYLYGGELPVASKRSHGPAVVRYFFAGEPDLDPREFRPESFKARVERISALMDSMDPDLNLFRARGGKLILKENLADYAQSPLAGVEYYNRVVEKLGQAQVDSFIRFYVTPGINHGGKGVDLLGDSLPNRVDLLDAIDGWVERKMTPDMLIQVSQDGKAPFAIGASRPMCRYPDWPRYKGTGSPNNAANFECATGLHLAVPVQ
jgi:feruloyl esterase